MSKSRLRAPLAGLFEERLAEPGVHRLWSRIARAQPKSSVPKTFLIAWAASTVCLLCALSYFWPNPAHLRLANHEKLPATISSHQPGSVSFEDGSRVELGPETLIDLLQNTDRSLVFALRNGRARFNVVPGGPRDWRIECGPLSVEVVGTIFSVERLPASVRVQVERGRVLVTGQGVPDRVARLSADESLVAPIEPLASAPTRALAGPPASAARSTAEPTSLPNPVTSHESRADDSTAHAHRPQSPESTLGPRNAGSSVAALPSAAPDAVDVLLQRADLAQRAGAPAQAASILQRLLEEHPHDGRVTLAQFTLGRLYLDSLGEPGQAAKYLTKALAGGIPAALAEDAQARLVQALARSGNSDGAADAAAQYRARYPTGRHLQDVARWSKTASHP
ncbi:MAG TPA: FecR domain-containing protein [Polyangiaceae bacterium]|nr:FecR domain-containing protein [Polyangiaceae bacterium]